MLLVAEVCESAKGGVRAGVLNSRNSRGRNKGNRNYHDNNWPGEDEYGQPKKRIRGDSAWYCDEVCQYR